MRKIFYTSIIVILLTTGFVSTEGSRSMPLYISDIEITEDGKILIGTQGTSELRLCNINGRIIRKWHFDEPVTGIALEKNLAYITSSGKKSLLTKIDISKRGKLAVAEVGSGPRSPLLSPDRKKIYVAIQYESTVCQFDTKDLKFEGKVKVVREPYSMAISSDGLRLLVTNFLPAGPSNEEYVAAAVSVIDPVSFTKIKDIKLTNGSSALKGICLSADSKYAFVVHNLGRYQIPTSQLEQGWMNTAGLSVLDVQNLEMLATIILDEPEHGAAGSWDVKCTADKILVTHSGTHDLSMIDYKMFIDKLLMVKDRQELAFNLNFLSGMRKRYPLSGNGPRNIFLSGTKAYIPSYFSDVVNVFDLSDYSEGAIPLNPGRQESPEDKGYRIFNDATYCFQGWQSCNGCHPGNAGVDGLNWDLMNDGVGNPKNTKSLLFSHATPPVMISGIRASAEVAVRAGFRHIQFSEINEDDARYVDSYVKSLTPVNSPWLVNGELSENAAKGKIIFGREGCAECHSGEYYTDLRSHRIGGEDKVVKEWKGWDTPTLREVWRTAPYLYNGCAADLKEVFGEFMHGLKQQLSDEEIEQLSEFVNSL